MKNWNSAGVPHAHLGRSICLLTLAVALGAGPMSVCAAAGETRATVRGVAVDEKGQPIASARIRGWRIHETAPLDPSKPDLDAATDARGRFEAKLDPGEYQVTATKGSLSGYAEWLLEAREILDGVKLLLREGGRILGTVTQAADRRPVASAMVVLEDGRVTATDGQGKFEFEGVPWGARWILIRAPGLAEETEIAHLTGREVAEVRVKMSPGISTRGRVTDAEGRPLRQAQVGRLVCGSVIHLAMQRALTDEDGRYRLGRLPQGRTCWLRASHPEFVEVTKEIPAPSNRQTGTLDFALARGFALEGDVRGPDGRPVRGAEVSYGFSQCTRGYRTTRTESSGRFRLNGLRGLDEEHLVVQAKGLAPAYQMVRPGRGGHVAPFSFRLDPGKVIEGRVVDRAGRPIAGVWISPRIHDPELYGWQYLTASGLNTDRQGRFRLDSLPDGKVTADVLAGGYSDVRDHPLTFDGKNTIIMHPPGVIVGRVVDAKTGRPITDFRVKCRWSQKIERRSEDGVFIIRDLTCPRPHDLVVTAKDYASTCLTEVVAQPADWRDWPLVIRLGLGETLRGQVTDAETNEPVAQAEVLLISSREPPPKPFPTALLDHPDKHGAEVLRAATDALGRFRIEGGGAWPHRRLLARADGHAMTLVSVDSDAIEIRLARGGAIAGTAKGVPDLDLASAFVAAEGEEFHVERVGVAEDGSYRIDHLPPGEWELALADSKGSKVELTVKVPAGQPLYVDFADPPGFAIRGRVLRGGKPSEDVNVCLHDGRRKDVWECITPDDDGHYSFVGLPPGPYGLSAEIDDHENDPRGRRSRKVVIDDQDVVVDFTFHTGRIRGRVVDAATGKPLKTGVVRAFRILRSDEAPAETLRPSFGPLFSRQGPFIYGWFGDRRPNSPGLRSTRPLGRVNYTTYTWAMVKDGRFEIVSLEPGTYILVVHGPLTFVLVRGVRLDSEDDAQTVQVRSDPRYSLRLRIIDSATKRPIPRARVILCAEDGFWLMSCRPRQKRNAKAGSSVDPSGLRYEYFESDAEGVIAFDGLQPAKYGVWVIAPAYRAQWVAPLPVASQNRGSEVSVSLSPTGALVLRPSEALLKGLTKPCVAYRVRNESGQAVYPGGEYEITPLETGVARLYGREAPEYRIDVIPPGRYTMAWEIHHQPLAVRVDELSPAVHRGNATFQIRPKGHTVVRLESE